MKDSFASYEICGYTVPFSILNISTHCLLASKVSNEKSVKNLIWNPLYVMNYFLTTLKILFVFRQFNYNVSQCGFPWLILSYLKFTELFGGPCACLSSHLRCFHPLFFSSSLSAPFSLLGFLQCICWSAWCCPTGHLGLHFSFLQYFFLLVTQLDNFNCPIFKVADSSAYSNLLLNPSSQFYFSYFIFKLQNFFLVYF